MLTRARERRGALDAVVSIRAEPPPATAGDLAQKYEREFEGMTEQPDSLDGLLATRQEIITPPVGEMPDEHRCFFVSSKKSQPDWDLLCVPHVADLPAVKFRQQQLASMSTETREAQIQKLVEVLFPAGS